MENGLGPQLTFYIFTFRAFSRGFDPKRLTISTIVRRNRYSISLSVQQGCEEACVLFSTISFGSCGS